MVELCGSRDDWQVIGQTHVGLVYKYIIQSSHETPDVAFRSATPTALTAIP